MLSLFHGIAHFYLVSRKKKEIFSERRERCMAMKEEENSFFKLLNPKAPFNFDHPPDTFPDSQTYTLRKKGLMGPLSLKR